MTGTGATIIYSEKEAIAFIEINRPDKKNALNNECWQLFDGYFEKLLSNSKIRALVIKGRTAEIFSAGFDVNPADPFIGDMFQALENDDKGKLVDGFAYIQDIISKLSRMPFPTVAAINGLCYGGGVELATACDIRVIKEGAVMCLPETRLGLIPDIGGTVRLAKLIGPGRAKELIFSGREIQPEEARELGLVNHIFPRKDFDSYVIEYVKSIIANSPSALQAAKEIVDATHSMDENEALAFERNKAADNLLSGQCIEGIGAFLEKRAPDWRN
jgi:enoyl-CoA hydratase